MVTSSASCATWNTIITLHLLEKEPFIKLHSCLATFMHDFKEESVLVFDELWFDDWLFNLCYDLVSDV